MRQKRAKNFGGIGFEQEFGGTGGWRRWFLIFAHTGGDSLQFANRHQCPDFRLLCERGNEIREENIDLIDFTFDEEVLRELGDGARFTEEGSIFVSEFGRELSLGSGDELRALSSGRNVSSRGLIEL